VLRKQLHRNYEREAKTFVILTYFNANLQQPLGFRGVNLWPLEPVVLWQLVNFNFQPFSRAFGGFIPLFSGPI